jgi:hypothetical protein
MHAVGIDPGEARAGWSFGTGEILKEENRRLGFAEENREVLPIVGSQ